MINRKGEISAVVILGMLIVMGIGAAISSTVNDQRQVINTRAATTSCANNPVPPPEGGYTWVANCSSSCTTNANCPQNTSDPSNVNPATSNWCYGFAEGAKCLQLQKGSGTVQPPNNNQTTSTPNPTNTGGTQGSVCTVATGCGGACNSNWNQGCGYGGCRAWEDCVNNTCIDTTNLGTQSAGENACQGLAAADSPENKQGQSTPTTVPQGQNPTAIPTVGTNPNSVPTVTPSPTSIPACRPGQFRCLSGECVENQGECPKPTPTQSISDQTRGNVTPTRVAVTSSPVNSNSSQTQCSVGLSGFCVADPEECVNFDEGESDSSLEGKWSTRSRSYGCTQPAGYCCAPKNIAEQPEWTPTPSPKKLSNGVAIPPLPTQTRKKIKVETDTTAKACTGTPSIDNGCIDVFGFYPQ